MSMWFSLSDQTAYFLSSLLFGAAIGVFYDVFRIVRLIFNNTKKVTLISDILFFSVIGITSSIFSIPFNSVGVRMFVIVGELIGFLVYRFTFGEISIKFYSLIIKLFKKFFTKSTKILKNFFNILLKMAAFMVYNVGAKMYKLLNLVFHRKRKEENERKELQNKEKRNVSKQNKRRNRRKKQTI